MHPIKSLSPFGKLTFVAVLAAGFAVQPSARAGTLFVNAGAPGCSPTGPVYCEIQDAINAAAEGDVILVSSGTYAPIEVATDNLIIQAVDGGEVVIDPMGVKGVNGVTLNSDGVTVRGLIVQNMVGVFDPAIFATVGGRGFVVSGNANRFYGNTARNNSHNGFAIDGDSNVLVGNTAHDNQNGFQSGGLSNVLNSNRAVANNNGFVLGGLGFNTLRGNLAEGNNFRGFFIVFNVENNTLQGNIARGNGDSGFMLLYGANSNLLRDNRAEGNGTAMKSDDNFGFVVARESNGNVLQGNIAEGNTGEGFTLADCDANTVEANLSQNNGEGGFLLADTVTATFDGGGTTFNTFKSNTARDNGGDGFAVLNGALTGADPTDFNAFVNNSSIQNTGWGFYVETLLSNTFENNNCQLNDLGGANVAGICR